VGLGEKRRRGRGKRGREEGRKGIRMKKKQKKAERRT
jgi:hypothetical protein